MPPRSELVRQQREQVQRALAPLAQNAVTDYEKAAAKRATDIAMVSVESLPVAQVLKTAFEMYRDDVDRAVRLRTGK